MVLQWLLPIGFLGFLGLGALIAIYVLRPRYKEKVLSSTFIWRRSLKYIKKRMPLDILRTILILLCQCIIIISLTIILAKPYLFDENMVGKGTERIVIIDSSASMHARLTDTSSGETRFDRAIREVKRSIDKWLVDEEGVLSVIVADNAPRYIIADAGFDDYTEVVMALDGVECSYGRSDMATAVMMAQERITSNPEAEVYIYTGTDYGNMGDVATVINLADAEKEWNIAILGCTTAIEKNEYVFYIDVAAYGNVSTVQTLYVEIKGAENVYGDVVDYPALEIPVTFDVDGDSEGMAAQQTIVVKATDRRIGGNANWYFNSFEEACIQFVGLNDSLSEDDLIMVYGGYKDKIKVQYYSSDPNSFFYLGFQMLKDNMSKTREILFTQVSDMEIPLTEGFDYYIFEHEIPQAVVDNGLPTDGVVILFDPDKSIDGLGIEFGNEVQLARFTYLTAGAEHPLTSYMKASRIGVSRYRKITSIDDDSFETLLYVNNDPIMLAKNVGASKVVVLPFSINQSNFSIVWDFQMLLYNLINYFMPVTLTDYSFEINDITKANCKGASIDVTNDRGQIVGILEDFPVDIRFAELGTYTFTTKFDLAKVDEVRKVFVKISAVESGIFKVADTRVVLTSKVSYSDLGQDIWVYFAAAIVVLLLAEWFLQFREIV